MKRIDKSETKNHKAGASYGNSTAKRFGGNRQHPEWIEIKNNNRRNILNRLGIPQLETNIEPREEQEFDTNKTIEDENETTEEVTNLGGFAVSPGDAQFPPATTVRAERVFDKWLRLEVEPPELVFDIQDTEQIQSSIEAGNQAISDAINARIDEWLNDESSETGGQLWAYPIGRTFTPEEVSDWNNTLQSIRDSALTKSISERRSEFAIPNLTITWDVNFSTDWSDTSRKSLHIAIENRSQRPPRQQRAYSDEGIYQVNLKCLLPKLIHRRMRLDRVKPSYRFNKYLHYSALGFNCGIREENTDDELTLTTGMDAALCSTKN